MAIKNFFVRLDDELPDKLHVIADYEGRSANRQVVILIRDCTEKNCVNTQKFSVHIDTANYISYNCIEKNCVNTQKFST